MSDDERRRVAERLMDEVGCGGSWLGMERLGLILGIKREPRTGWEGRILTRLADLIEPSCDRDTPQKVAEEMFGKMRHSTKEEEDAYDAMLKSKSVEIHPVDRDALLEEVKELEKCAGYFGLDFDEDEPLRDRLEEASEDFAGSARRIRKALEVES